MFRSYLDPWEEVLYSGVEEGERSNCWSCYCPWTLLYLTFICLLPSLLFLSPLHLAPICPQRLSFSKEPQLQPPPKSCSSPIVRVPWHAHLSALHLVQGLINLSPSVEGWPLHSTAWLRFGAELGDRIELSGKWPLRGGSRERNELAWVRSSYFRFRFTN